NQLTFTLRLYKEAGEQNTDNVILSRQVTYSPTKTHPIKVINKIGENIYSTDTKYNNELKKIFFQSDIDKPTFRQLIPKFVRENDFEISNILRYLYKGTSNSEYELIHFFLFGF